MNYQNKGKKDKSAQMRTVYITLVLALSLMTVLIVLTGAWRRSTDRIEKTVTTEVIVTVPEVQVIAPQTNTLSESDMTDEAETSTEDAAATDESSSESTKPTAAEALPDFVAPVSGYILNAHSGDNPVFSPTMNDYRPHSGVDIYGAAGDDVFAAADGTVDKIWEDPMSGNCISISHNGCAVSIYRNLAPQVPEGIEEGCTVSAGEVIGSIGDTSLLEVAEESHLHFELTVDGVQVDPAAYISFPAVDTEYED